MGRTPKISTDEIIAAAREVFLDRGAGASTAEIAERAGISEASIFKRFATKQDLFVAAIGVPKTPAWEKRLERDIPASEFKAELIEILSEMFASYQDILPRALMMMSPLKLLRTQQFVPPPVRDSKLLADFLDRAIAAGAIAPCNATAVAHTLVGAVHNYTMTQSLLAKFPAAAAPMKDRSIAPEDFIHHLVETIWWGISPDSPRSK
jgi:AcrR family transcriptional regulator